ncbi:Eukaryotic translation initiation factor eIF2A family protein [Cryptosporidium meleagridis]|uniref:Eukaryotic translation initiation factor 2A n=1 Tax=Cryptosporidium meleagridis TaxID=93969 RepID=A0A2P4Z244_9CRYT|nr:Eukaryotic translation initiation factor eIF2A family protein [Cryptosporidium meleagridis]
MSRVVEYDDEIVCLGKGGVYRLRGMTKNEVNSEELTVDNPIAFLEGVEIYAQEPQGRGYCFVPKDSKNSVILITKGEGEANKEIKIENDFPVRKLQYSPLGSYLLVLTVFEQGKNENNLQVYKLKENLKQLFSFPFKTNSAKVLSTWPPYRWSNNEIFVFKVQDTSVSIFKSDTESLENPIGTLNFSKSIQLSVSNEIDGGSGLGEEGSKTSSLNFTVVTPQSAQNMDVYVYHAEMDSKKEIQLSSIGQVCVKEAQTCQVSWNNLGDSILVFAQIEGETLGKSYFGSSSLHLLRIQNSKTVVANSAWKGNKGGNNDIENGIKNGSDGFKPSEKLSLRHQVVVPPEEGPVNDVAWSPKSNEFLLCKGIIPPELTLNSGIDGSPKVSFGKSRRNTIRWNPSGKWFAYGGFGNLAGDLDIWDLDKQKLIGQTNASCCITLEWSVCGRFLLASTTSPRLRVDNAIRIFRYNGDLLKRVNFDTLYSAYWSPKTADYRRSVKYRSVSPGREFNSKPQPEKQIYRPKWASSGFAERMRAARDSNNVPTVVNVKQKPKNEYVIPGLPTLEASAAAVASSRQSNHRQKQKQKPKK